MSATDWGLFISGFALWVLVMILIRDLICWYFKINQRIKLLEEIRDKLG